MKEFTTLLHNGNHIDKEVLYNACMQIENPEIELWMPDWSGSKTNACDGHKNEKRDPFLAFQRAILLLLRQELFDSMAEVTASSRSSDSEALPLKTHQADAASDMYDREFALNLLSHEQTALYEIDHALRRIELGTYGMCEMSGKPIPRPRLEAIPWARFSVECQAQLEKENKALLLSRRVEAFTLIKNEEEEDQEGEGNRSEIDEIPLTAA